MLKQLQRIACLMGALAGSAAAAAAAADSKADQAGCSHLTISGPVEYPPLSWGEGKTLKGAGFDLALQIAKRVGIPATVVYAGSWPRTLTRHKEGEIDILVALYRTPDRDTKMIFLAPWAHERTVVVMNKKHAFSFNTWGDLIGRIGASARNDSHGERFDRFAANNLKILPIPTQANMFSMLEAGRVDYAILGEFSPYADRFYNPGSDLLVADRPVSSHEVFMSLSRRSPCAGEASRLKTALEGLITDGTVTATIENFRNNRAQAR